MPLSLNRKGEEKLIYSGEFWGGQTVERMVPDCIFLEKKCEVGGSGRKDPGRRRVQTNAAVAELPSGLRSNMASVHAN